MPTTIVSLVRTMPEDRARIEATAPGARLIDAGGWFDGEIRETWPAATVARYLRADAEGRGSRAERDALLGEADIVIGGFPFPRDLRARAPRLKWFHQRPAGASNLREGDLWGSGVTVTTSRGHAANAAMAEYVLAGFLHFARGLHRAPRDAAAGAFDYRAYRPVLLEGKTACVVGVGGIGRAVGRRCAALGMRVVGTRRRAGGAAPEGFAEVRGADGLHELLAESDFVAVCCQWTPETTGLVGEAAFAALKPGAVLVNVARGEIVDEAALLAALAADRLRGAALDVYVGEFEGPPDARLWRDPRVLLTPHVSAASEAGGSRWIEVFCRNLEAWLAGRPLENVVDWARGY